MYGGSSKHIYHVIEAGMKFERSSFREITYDSCFMTRVEEWRKKKEGDKKQDQCVKFAEHLHQER